MAFTPGFLAWKSFLPGPESSGYAYEATNADLIIAEANALPGRWKWFPVPGGPDATNYESQGHAAAAWAGVPYSGSTSNPTIGKGVAAVGSAATSGLAAFFQGNIWIRVGEAVLGLVLIAIGLARITKAVPIATSIAKKAGAVGVIAA